MKFREISTDYPIFGTRPEKSGPRTKNFRKFRKNRRKIVENRQKSRNFSIFGENSKFWRVTPCKIRNLLSESSILRDIFAIFSILTTFSGKFFRKSRKSGKSRKIRENRRFCPFLGNFRHFRPKLLNFQRYTLFFSPNVADLATGTGISNPKGPVPLSWPLCSVYRGPSVSDGENK